MSFIATNWAQNQPLKSSLGKPTLIALADFANDANQCWPSQQKLADITGLSDRTVRKHLRNLESYGVISRQKRVVNGQFSSDLITLNLQLNLPSEVLANGKIGYVPVEKLAAYPSLEPLLIKKGMRAECSDQLDIFTADESHYEFCKRSNLDVDDQIQRFKDHQRSNGLNSLDWAASFRTWLSIAVQFKEKRHTPKLVSSPIVGEAKPFKGTWLKALTTKEPK